MSEVVAIVEGQTEQKFVNGQLAEHLGYQGVTIWAVLSGKPKRSGGVKKWKVTRRDILRELKAGRYCTTMFDFYGMPDDWPGRVDAKDQPSDVRGDYVEKALLEDIASETNRKFDIKKFIPYVQVHEFEAILFSDVEVLAETTAPLMGVAPIQLNKKFALIRGKANTPEDINDGYNTCPSRRISDLVPGYRKAHIGPIVAELIGLEKIQKECTHFSQWYSKLEQIGNQ